MLRHAIGHASGQATASQPARVIAAQEVSTQAWRYAQAIGSHHAVDGWRNRGARANTCCAQGRIARQSTEEGRKQLTGLRLALSGHPVRIKATQTIKTGRR